MTFSLTDLRYFLRLIKTYGIYDEDERTISQSMRVERKLREMVRRARRKISFVDVNMSTTANQEGPIRPMTLTIYRSMGGGQMAAKNLSMATPKKPKGKIGKSVKRK